jgi:hypothetical protein
LIGLVSAILLLSACNRILNPIPTQFTLENTPIPSLSVTTNPTETLTPTPEPTQTETATPTETPVPEVYDWNFVSQRSDEEIFNVIGVPNPVDYLLNVEITPGKILRNEGGQSYALFQNSEGIVLLAENLETKIVEHAVYAEYEGGVPLLLLTDQSVVKKDNGWFQLNETYPASDARDRLAHAFNRALSMRWWGVNHKNASTIPYGVKDWLDEIPGFHAAEFNPLTRNERTQISDYIMQRFLESLQNARANNSSLPIELADKNRTVYDAANETMVIKTVLSRSPYWAPIFEHFMDSIHRVVTSEISGVFVTLFLSQPDFLPIREPRPVGGAFTHFFRYFFGASYFYSTANTDFRRLEQPDMTGPILEDLCAGGSISDETLNFYNKVYPTMDLDTNPSVTNTCSVVFGK